MPFDWKALIDLAREWQRSVTGVTEVAKADAVLRSALSRIYFGVFCHARNYARDWLGFQLRVDSDDHGRLRAHLKSRRRAGDSDRLDRLRRWRNECDYADELTFDLPAAVVSALQMAERVLASLKAPSRS